MCLSYTPTPLKIWLPSMTNLCFLSGDIPVVLISNAIPKRCFDLAEPPVCLLCFLQRNPELILSGNPKRYLRAWSFIKTSIKESSHALVVEGSAEEELKRYLVFVVALILCGMTSSWVFLVVRS
mgnify:CR=1 FL=1